MKNKLARRRGNIVALTAVLMIVLVAFVALAVDIGYLYTVRNELQRTADAAAIAATWELIDKDSNPQAMNASNLAENARSKASQFAALNKVSNVAPALATSDVSVGYMADPSNPNEPMVATPTGKLPNAVYVRVQRTGDQNGQIQLFFAKAFGFQSQAMQAQATAALRSGCSGFKMPGDGSNLNILPYALDETTWNNLSISGTDSWSYNPSTKTVTAGADGIKECNLFPQGTGSTANRGTLDIGGGNNTTSDVKRQIVYGINQSDMDLLAAQDRTLEFNADGALRLNGDTGISAGVRDEMMSIIGEPRILPIFCTVVGPGNNAEYTIVKFVGVRIMYVKLSGSSTNKAVMLQPCNVVAKGAIYKDEGTSGSDFVYSPVWLVR